MTLAEGTMLLWITFGFLPVVTPSSHFHSLICALPTMTVPPETSTCARLLSNFYFNPMTVTFFINHNRRWPDRNGFVHSLLSRAQTPMLVAW
ncbi:hypothetical protein B0H65DRAFT_466541 [Neurospora tetraspora]|uniref:Secreted protein n=1 Tax=Neurospora tetraspora TaxID=94610 RepID=A0AAE0JFK3_9PEZI|nr:hypothetical protein B0H65DRAFT_466541 [Neurospora tetraspora]